MSILYEILIATVFSALLTPQTEVVGQELEKSKTEKIVATRKRCEVKEAF